MRKFQVNAAVAVAALSGVCGASGQVVIQTVRVGGAGNIGELSGDAVNMWGNQFGIGQPRVCGAVDYPYEIGKYEVTAAQYVAFLNAVAATDPYGLYNTFAMPPGEPLPIGIVRSGASGSYTYSVAPDWADRPVGGLSWADAARFANWMHNGQPTGLQGPGTTEDGAYTLNGATTNPQLQNVVRNPGAVWALPTEDEWYKAAYHKNNGPTGCYWDFPTRSDSGFLGQGWPNNDVINPDPGNSANFWQSSSTTLDDDCIGPPYWRTPVGEFENSASEYGTFDQGGNIWEWTEGRPSAAGTPGSKRVQRGGSFYNLLESVECLHSAWRHDEFAAAQLSRFGVRLVHLLPTDCNGNGTPDRTDLMTGASHDRNFNDVPDECDISVGTSQDCNANGIPDEVEIGAVAAPLYTWDDGVREDMTGLEGGGSMAWLNQFTILPGRSTIGAVAISYGYVPNGTTVKIGVWSDPNGDSNPSDAALLVLVTASVASMNSDVLNVVDIPDTYIGPPGTKFFVGALIRHAAEQFPANLDYSTSLSATPSQSWLFAETAPNVDVDPANLSAATFQGNLPFYGYSANWTVRALSPPSVATNDANGNGTPDDCEFCAADFDHNGAVQPADVAAFVSAWFASLTGGTLAGDFDHNGQVEPADVAAFVGAWANALSSPCP